ncbi:yjeF C-terminal region, hydroxyethylthiazole kinase-related/yjeF N-terminal region [Formivibrio citricus]|uniref:Bifunctional NAD(P)H-hydrate repair enzyme n=1 Tax=Formivibrio citricus TaxID=83765 RepID=A0A1I4XPZ6_9NEIS|nr:NAD(P)H-hydrate dehydratase [Formivibrio citricus]SFN27503.1 yjeF C-terminal region, hydroxyethylthiazole kinase-related/yjeF N-terminal region [Formivibrio citricus]
MKPLFALDSIRQIETAALGEGLPLMERAGLAAAELILRQHPKANRVLVLCGPGNNGGDGLVCARILHENGLESACWFLNEPAYRGDAAQAFACWQAAGSKPAPTPDFPRYDLIVDALFGIGFSREFDSRTQDLIRALNASGKPVLAIDVPSGLDAFTGATHDIAVRAAQTLTYIVDKPGLHTGVGRDHAGLVEVETLGIEARHFPPADGELVDAPPAALQKLQRPADSHKGRFGSVAIFGGADGMLGAPLLAGRAALKLGTGKVRVGFLAENHPAFDPAQPELMLHSAQTLATHPDKTLLVAGPGLGQSEAALLLLKQLLHEPLPLILDADALNLIAQQAGLQTLLHERSAPSVITPHPAEAARLLGCTSREIQRDRIGAAQTLAQRCNSTVQLKGTGTVVCTDQRWRINGSGNAALSNAGQGDALCGILAALWAQGLDSFEATSCAAWLHGAAADVWRQTHPLGVGLTASEVIDLSRGLLNSSAVNENIS